MNPGAANHDTVVGHRKKGPPQALLSAQKTAGTGPLVASGGLRNPSIIRWEGRAAQSGTARLVSRFQALAGSASLSLSTPGQWSLTRPPRSSPAYPVSRAGHSLFFRLHPAPRPP